MSPNVEELWSARDDLRVERLLAARDAGDLPSALFAIEDVSPDEADRDRERLDAWAVHVRARAPGNPEGDARALAEVLGGDLGFRGDPGDYDHPHNSHLHRVMERRRGLPVLLSVVWMEVGQRAGVRVAGIGLPGHFVVRVGGPPGVFADPFHGGRAMSEAECRRIARDATGSADFRDAWLAETPGAEIVERVLRNLAGSARRRRDGVALYRSLSMLSELRPDLAPLALERAQVAQSLGAQALARAQLADVLRRFAGTPEAEVARRSTPAVHVLH